MQGASETPPMWPSGMPAAFPGPWPTQGAVEATPLSQDSEDRFSRRKRRNAYEKQSRQRAAAGAKPNCVYVLPRGEVDGGSEGKNAWDEAIRELVPKIMDMSVVEWSKHPPHRVKKLRDALDSEFEYVGNPLSMAGFRAAITRFMKSERSRLKTRYLKDEKTVPTHIHPDQWKRLKDYWKTDAQKLKSKKMAEARQSVKNYALVGRKGKAARESVVVRTNQFLK